MNKIKLELLDVKTSGTVMGFRAYIRNIVHFFISMGVIVSTFAAYMEGLEFLGIIAWIVWMLLFYNLILPWVNKIVKPRLVYNRRRKKFYFKYNFMEFTTISRKNSSFYREVGKDGGFILSGGKSVNGNGGTFSMVIDPYDEDTLMEIHNEWNRK